MTSLINKIEQLIKREKTTPERKHKDDSNKSSSEILSELFGAFNAAPPKIEDISLKKTKRSKKKHKKEKKKRSRSSSSSSDSVNSEYSHKRKKRKKSKLKKRKDHDRSPSYTRSRTPVLVKQETEQKIKPEPGQPPLDFKTIKEEHSTSTKTEFIDDPVKSKKQEIIYIKEEDKSVIDASLIPMPESPCSKDEFSDLRTKLDKKSDSNGESDKAKGKILIKNLKFSTVYEETVKKAEEEARKRAEKYEEGEYTDSSSSSVKEDTISQFPKSSDPGGILKKQAEEEIKIPDEENCSTKKSTSSKKSESSLKSPRKESDKNKERCKSKEKDSSKSHKSKSSRRSRSPRRRRRSRSRSHRRSRSRSRSRRREHSRSRRRDRTRHTSPRRRRSRSGGAGVRLADSEKRRLLEVARRNAITMLRSGALPAAAALPPHARPTVMAAIHAGGKSVDELTDFCKHLSKKEALGELSSVSSAASDDEDTLAFHHPFLVKEKAPIVMNIRGGAPLPLRSVGAAANKEELRLQFPVSSGTQHRDHAWVPVLADQQVAKLNSKPAKSDVVEKLKEPAAPPAYMTGFTSGTQLSSVPPAADAALDVSSLVSQRIADIRRQQERAEPPPHTEAGVAGAGVGGAGVALGQFSGSTGCAVLTPRQLASGAHAWAKKDQLRRAAPVAGGMGMALLQKMGWTPGQGLGKGGTGALTPLLLDLKLDTRGLSAKEEARPPPRAPRARHHPAPAAAPAAHAPAPASKHPVSLLGEHCSKLKLGPPEYHLCFECGPDHKKNFLFKVKVAGVEYQPAVASANKKQAKADAAQLALTKLGLLH